LFTFDQFSTDVNLADGQHPVWWKIINFGPKGHYEGNITYKNQFAFILPQNDEDEIISASTYVDIKPGQSTTLTKPDPQIYQFSTPVVAEELGDRLVRAVNGSGKSQDIGFGIHANPGRGPTPVLYFKGVREDQHVEAQFTPFLRLYITTSLETTIIRATSTQLVWSQNLDQLDDDHTFWALTRNSEGLYQVTKA